MDWKNLTTTTNNKLADLINILFNSVFRKILDETLQPSEHPTIRLSDFTINYSEVSG